MRVQVLVGDILNSDMVTLSGVFCMFLSQLLGSRQLFGSGNGSGSGSHCVYKRPVGRQTIQETKRVLTSRDVLTGRAVKS